MSDDRRTDSADGIVADEAPAPGWWRASDGRWYAPDRHGGTAGETAPGPGWWRASDGKWYPPAEGAAPTAPQPPVTPPDRWWSRKPPEERRPWLSRLLWNTWEFRHPWKVFFAAFVGLLLLLMVVSTVLVLVGGDSSSDREVTTAGAPAGDDQLIDVTVRGDRLPLFESEVDDDALGLAAPVVRGPAPDGRAVEIGGESDDLHIVVFVAAWDPHSPGSVQATADAVDDLLGDDTEVTVVAGPDREGVIDLDGWLVDNGWRGRAMLDSSDGDAHRAFGGTAYPFAVALDEDGVVVARRVGTLEPQDLADLTAGETTAALADPLDEPADDVAEEVDDPAEAVDDPAEAVDEPAEAVAEPVIDEAGAFCAAYAAEIEASEDDTALYSGPEATRAYLETSVAAHQQLVEIAPDGIRPAAEEAHLLLTELTAVFAGFDYDVFALVEDPDALAAVETIALASEAPFLEMDFYCAAAGA